MGLMLRLVGKAMERQSTHFFAEFLVFVEVCICIRDALSCV